MWRPFPPRSILALEPKYAVQWLLERSMSESEKAKEVNAIDLVLVS
jgi:hypothetical protein